MQSRRRFLASRVEGPAGEHFDGRRFFNPGMTEKHVGLAALKWLATRKLGPWKAQPDAAFGPPPPQRVETGRMRVTYVNHATVLVQMDGMNLLTDPIWSERCSPVGFAGPKRMRPPGLRFEDLPPIDAVLISHDHYDHLDLPTLKRLAKAHRPAIFTGLGNRALLEAEGIAGATELDWWQEAPLGEQLKITVVPAQHFSGRGVHDRDSTLWAGLVVSGPAGHCYFAGDTGFGPHFEEIGRRFGSIRVALLPIGAYLPRWFMAPVHMDPEGAVQAHEALGAATSVGIHFGTFPLADDGQHEPEQELEKALATRQERPRFWVLGFGEGREVPALDTARAGTGA